MTDEDSLCAVLGAGRMELCWPFVMMHCSPQSANRKHVLSVSKILVVETDVFALHIAIIL
jgi:GTP cyclohydrolase III